MADSTLKSLEEFQASFKYFFFLFRKEFPPSLEAAARAQWAALKQGDAVVKEDGQNNPLVEMRLDPEFGRALCAALADAHGNLPCLNVPPTAEQVAFWQMQSRETLFPDAFVELSENASHWETIREAMAWHIASQGAVADDVPVRVCILGASARYEYSGGVSRLLEWLGKIVDALRLARPIEFLMCGRDVPAELHGHDTVLKDGRFIARHRVGYLHDLQGLDASVLRGALFIALHSGIGVEHPELSASWPPTLAPLQAAAPVSLVVTSFNPVEHETAERTLRSMLPGLLQVDHSGVNSAGSLHGPEVVGPFDGVQGKRNYCLLRARLVPLEKSSEGWDLFD